MSTLCLAEAHGPLVSTGWQVLLWCLTLPCLWDDSDGQMPAVGSHNTLGKWWSHRLPMCLMLFFKIHGSAILDGISWKIPVAGYAIFTLTWVAAGAVSMFSVRDSKWYGFGTEALLQVFYMMFVRAHPTSQDANNPHRVNKESRDPNVRRSWDTCVGVVVAASHMSPIMLALDSLQLYNHTNQNICKHCDFEWYVTFPVVGILYLLSSFSLSIFVWIFVLHPVNTSIQAVLDACPDSLTNLAIGPAALAAIIYVQGHTLKASYFQSVA